MAKKSEHDFSTYMEKYLDSYIVRPPCQSESINIENAFKNVRVAVLDTGFCLHEDDVFLQGAASRVKLKENFAGPDPQNCQDLHGHGTHVARLLLRFAPEADIYIAKVSDYRSLKKTKMNQLACVMPLPTIARTTFTDMA